MANNLPFVRATEMGEKEAWRDLDEDKRYQMVLSLAKAMLARYEAGAVEHGEYFTDDPLDQLEQELMDGIFYVQMARRQRDAARLDSASSSSREEPESESRIGRWIRSVLGGGLGGQAG